MDAFDSHGLIILNTGEVTYTKGNSASCLDLTIVTRNLESATWNVLDNIYDSDHIPQVIEIETNHYRNREANLNFNKADWDLYKEVFEFTLDMHEDINTTVDKFAESIIKAAETAIPKLNTSFKRSLPYWDNELTDRIKDVKKKKRKFMRTRERRDRHEYNIARVEFRDVMKEKRESSWKKLLEEVENTSDAKLIYNRVNRLREKKKTSFKYMIDEDNEVLKDLIEICEKIGQKIANISSDSTLDSRMKAMKRSLNDEIIPIPPDPACKEMYNRSITGIELVRALGASSGSSPGPDRVTYAMVKNLPEHGLEDLVKIYNIIYKTGVFPEAWRQAIVVLIPKPGKIHSLDNIRPISLTCVLCKILERIVDKRLKAFLEENDYLPDEQNGFRNGRTTMDSICEND
jgi:Reverse transcriptase (RNA-dependent DNA polymerase)